MIQIGKHDELITILQAAEIIDDKGDKQETWVELTEPLWAEVVEVGARERMRNPQVRGEIDVTFHIRHPGVSMNSKMRVQRDDGRLYEITGITQLPGRRVGFEIQAKSLDATGATSA